MSDNQFMASKECSQIVGDRLDIIGQPVDMGSARKGFILE